MALSKYIINYNLRKIKYYHQCCQSLNIFPTYGKIINNVPPKGCSNTYWQLFWEAKSPVQPYNSTIFIFAQLQMPFSY